MRFGGTDADVDFLDGALHGIRFCIPDAAPMPVPLPFWDIADVVVQMLSLVVSDIFSFY